MQCYDGVWPAMHLSDKCACNGVFRGAAPNMMLQELAMNASVARTLI